MKARIYLRIGQGSRGTLVRADKKPIYEPIVVGSYNKKYLPTVQIALDLEIPDKEFQASRILLEAKIKETNSCVDIKQIIEGEKK